MLNIFKNKKQQIETREENEVMYDVIEICTRNGNRLVLGSYSTLRQAEYVAAGWATYETIGMFEYSIEKREVR